MSYRLIGKTEEIFAGYGPRKGLEGPFHFSGRILYYDPTEGKYYDPKTDFYVMHDEIIEALKS